MQIPSWQGLQELTIPQNKSSADAKGVARRVGKERASGGSCTFRLLVESCRVVVIELASILKDFALHGPDQLKYLARMF